MEQHVKEKLLSDIAQFETDGGSLAPIDAERVLFGVVEPLLANDGYEAQFTGGPRDDGFDVRATRPASEKSDSHRIGIQFKHYRNSQVGPAQVRELIGAAVASNVNRAMLIVTTAFTEAARDLVRRELPLQIELIDVDALKAWIARIDVDERIDTSEIRQIIKSVSQRFAQIIAENPRALDELEWRDLERTLAEVFEGLGFTVELTPGSKDGGKDIVLECSVQGKLHTYIVEIKHWRSGIRVGSSAAKSFLNVIVREGREAGLFLSTYGYCDNAFESLTEIERRQLRFGTEHKVVALCQTFVKATSGIWSPPERLSEVLFEGTA
jgi:restriction system protein